MKSIDDAVRSAVKKTQTGGRLGLQVYVYPPGHAFVGVLMPDGSRACADVPVDSPEELALVLAQVVNRLYRETRALYP